MVGFSSLSRAPAGTPTPTRRAGIRRSNGIHLQKPTGPTADPAACGRARSRSHRSWMNTWTRCVARVGHSRRRCTARRSASCTRPARAAPASMIRGRHRVLNRQVDADAADRRHRVRRVADAQQPGPLPVAQPVDLHGQQLHVVPVVRARRRGRARNGASLAIAARGTPAGRARGISSMPPFRDDERALPVVAAVEHDEHVPASTSAERSLADRRRARKPHPEHVHRRAEVLDGRPGLRAHRRVPAVGADHQVGADLERAAGASRRARRRSRPPSSMRPVDLGLHRAAGTSGSRRASAARKSRKSHCGIKAMNWQRVGRCEKSAIVTRRRRSRPASSRPPDAAAAGTSRAAPSSCEHLERRRVDRVAAEIAQEVARASRARRPRRRRARGAAEHHPGRPAAGDAALHAHRRHTVTRAPRRSRRGRPGRAPRQSPDPCGPQCTSTP